MIEIILNGNTLEIEQTNDSFIELESLLNVSKDSSNNMCDIC
jgi:hypothetical protein